MARATRINIGWCMIATALFGYFVPSPNWPSSSASSPLASVACSR